MKLAFFLLLMAVVSITFVQAKYGVIGKNRRCSDENKFDIDGNDCKAYALTRSNWLSFATERSSYYPRGCYMIDNVVYFNLYRYLGNRYYDAAPICTNLETGFRDCTDAGGPGRTCTNCNGREGEPCRVNPRSSDPQTGILCGSCSAFPTSDGNSCLHSSGGYESRYDKNPARCEL